MFPVEEPAGQHMEACSKPKGASRDVPNSWGIWLAKSVPPATSLVNWTARPLFSCNISCWDHWQDGKAPGFGCTVDGTPESVTCGPPKGATRVRVACCDHVRPSASIPVNLYSRVEGKVA